MNQKYKISSISTLFTISVKFSNSENENNENKEIKVLLDYENDKVYFTDKSDETLDYDQLEKQILQSLKPVDLESPIMPDIAYQKDWGPPDVFSEKRSVFEEEI